LDWEYIGRQGDGNNIVSSKDAQDFLSFLRVLRPMVGNKLITSAVPTTLVTGMDGNPIGDVSQYSLYLDFVNIMTAGFSFLSSFPAS
jgi:chitinase